MCVAHACVAGSYYYVITNFGNYLNLLKTDWQRAFINSIKRTDTDCSTVAIHSALQCSSVFIVLCLFGYRSYVVSGRKLWVALLIVTCSTVQLAFGISVTSELICPFLVLAEQIAVKEFELEFL